MSEIEKEMLKTLEEIRKWLRFSGWTNVKEVLIDTLDEPEKIVAYSLTDGDTSIRNIRDKTGMSFGAIQNWWKIWAQVGIVETFEAGRGTRARALFNLEDFGIEIPELKLDEDESKEEDEVE